jgi:hypothetical protein
MTLLTLPLLRAQLASCASWRPEGAHLRKLELDPDPRNALRVLRVQWLQWSQNKFIVN